MDNARLTALRAHMAEAGIDAYIVPTADDHESEYVGEHYKARAFCTGFTGSAGICAVTQEDAVLWTDGRYFIQAAREIEGSGFRLLRSGANKRRQPLILSKTDKWDERSLNHVKKYSQHFNTGAAEGPDGDGPQR